MVYINIICLIITLFFGYKLIKSTIELRKTTEEYNKYLKENNNFYKKMKENFSRDDIL